MDYIERPPSPALANYVKCFWALTIEDAGGTSEPETVLPDGSLEIVFNLADRFRRFHADGNVELQPLSIVVGQMRRFVRIQPIGRVDLFGVRFKTVGAYHLFKCSLADLTDKIVELDCLLASSARNLEERINLARSTQDRITIIERSLLDSLRTPGSNERLVEAVKDHIVQNGGVVSIYQTSRNFGVSQRQLERHFKQMVGVSPKFYSKIVRLQNVLAASEFQRSYDMLDLALRFGYYDQSHFVREFTEFAGKSPTSYLKDVNRMSEAFIGT